jgi:hypothetical protein
MSVNEYVTKFTQLSCYTPHEVDTDEKKQECFLNDLKIAGTSEFCKNTYGQKSLISSSHLCCLMFRFS